MPGSIISEWLLRPLIELLLQLLGYWTGRIVVPALSFGLIRIEHIERAKRIRPRWHGFHRGKDGGIVIDDEMTMLLGFLSWVVVAAAAYFILR
jgi:hypothetical protein